MEAEIKFEREKTNGIAVVGSYLIDAERRLGVSVESDCGRLGLCDSCAVIVKSGSEFLTAPTKAETEILSEERLADGERLACQVKIATEGEIVIVTKDRKDPRNEKEKLDEDFRKDFEELPLEGKVSKLMELEAITLNETLSFIMNAPYKIGGKVVDILSGFGFQKENVVAEPEAEVHSEAHSTEEVVESEEIEADEIIDAELPVSEPAEEVDAVVAEIVPDENEKGNEQSREIM